jgi:hypothetical protein
VVPTRTHFLRRAARIRPTIKSPVAVVPSVPPASSLQVTLAAPVSHLHRQPEPIYVREDTPVVVVPVRSEPYCLGLRVWRKTAMNLGRITRVECVTNSLTNSGLMQMFGPS